MGRGGLQFNRTGVLTREKHHVKTGRQERMPRGTAASQGMPGAVEE